ncbi:MAG: PmoA family protein [Phycisphaerales bacterium]|nr:PmoA family protein [Phycisphaerales bacterium]
MIRISLLIFFMCSACGCQVSQPVHVETDGTIARITVGDLPFTTYHAVLPRPYLYPVRTADGRYITRGYPMDPHPDEASDHPHHVSLWFAHGDVNGKDFWQGQANRIETLSMTRLDDGLVIENQWLDADDKLACSETREIQFAGRSDERTIDWDIELVSPNEPLRMGDTKEGSLAIRLAPPLRLDGNLAHGQYLTSEGLRDAEAWGSRARWVACTGLLEGGPVTVAIFDHPGNPNHPTWWHARDYGLFAANPFGRQDFESSTGPTGAVMALDGVPLQMRYRVLIMDASLDADRIETAWQDWVREVRGSKE